MRSGQRGIDTFCIQNKHVQSVWRNENKNEFTVQPRKRALEFKLYIFWNINVNVGRISYIRKKKNDFSP